MSTPEELAEKVGEAIDWQDGQVGDVARSALAELATRAKQSGAHKTRARQSHDRAEAAEAERDEAKQRSAQNKGVWKECEEHVTELEARLAEAEKALAHYADEDHWTAEVGDVYTTWWYDGGHELPWAVAVVALAALREKP